MFSLQKYRSILNRYTCPQCGRKHSFTLYVDENGTPLADNVGRCNHESSCGYHYTPKEYFALHPQPLGEHKPYKPQIKPIQPQKKCCLNFDYVKQSESFRSDLFTYLSGVFGVEATKQVFSMYHVGATKERDVIYWQLDTCATARTGKIMKYDVATGKRIKGEFDCINWVHSKLKKEKKLPNEWVLSQCLFGEHLLKVHPDKAVCVVESEKTALICAITMPHYIWLATGGKHNLKPEILNILRNRKVILYPDVDAFDKWKSIAQALPFYVLVSDTLQRIATEEDKANKIDIADVILRTWKPQQ